jgi:hypothetical protein
MAQPVFPQMANLLHEQDLLKRPEVKRMTQLDKAMADTLSRSDLTASQKIRQYDALIQPFRAVRENIEKNGTQITSSNKSEELIKQLMDFISSATQPGFTTPRFAKKRHSHLQAPSTVKTEGISDISSIAHDHKTQSSRDSTKEYKDDEEEDDDAYNAQFPALDGLETILTPASNKSTGKKSHSSAASFDTASETSIDSAHQPTEDNRFWNKVLKTAFKKTGNHPETLRKSDDKYIFNDSKNKSIDITNRIQELEQYMTATYNKKIPKRLNQSLYNIINTLEKKDPYVLAEMYRRFPSIKQFISNNANLVEKLNENEQFKTDFPAWENELKTRPEGRVLRPRTEVQQSTAKKAKTSKRIPTDTAATNDPIDMMELFDE